MTKIRTFQQRIGITKYANLYVDQFLHVYTKNLSGIRFLFSALGHARFLREFTFGSLYSVRKAVSWGFNTTLVICPICYLWLIVSLYYFLKVHSMFWKVLNAKVILLHEDGITFSIQLFHDMVVYVVSLEFLDSQEFAILGK